MTPDASQPTRPLLALLPSHTGVCHLDGLRGSAAPFLAALAGTQGPVLYLAADGAAVDRAWADLTYYLQQQGGGTDRTPLRLTCPELPSFAPAYPERTTAHRRSAALTRLALDPNRAIIVADSGSLLRRQAPLEAFAQASLRLVPQQQIDPSEFSRQLVSLGYARLSVVEDEGSFAVRGALIDLWPAGAYRPVRCELDGNLLLRLDEFLPDAQQRVGGPLPEVIVPAAGELPLRQRWLGDAMVAVRALCDEARLPSSRTRRLLEQLELDQGFLGADTFAPAFPLTSTLATCLPWSTILVEDGPSFHAALAELHERHTTLYAETAELPRFPLERYSQTPDSAAKELEASPTVVFSAATQRGVPATALESLTLCAEEPRKFPGDGNEELIAELVRARGSEHPLAPLRERITNWLQAGDAVELVARTGQQRERLEVLLAHEGLNRSGLRLQVTQGPLARGLRLPQLQRAWVTEEEIFGRRAHRRPTPKTRRQVGLEDFRSLTEGCFLIHEEHGIGRFEGLERRVVGEARVDFLVLRYDGGKLFLPAYRLNLVQLYRGSDPRPKLDKLGGSTFARTKSQAQKRVQELADQLFRLYAERAARSKTPLPPAGDDYLAFEASFPHEETEDQRAAIEEVLKDLESPRISDRVVCGDVGFGKTEVALRAAFRIAMAGRQVGILCPTTVLAQQHFRTCEARFTGFPLNVAVLSRFESAAQVERTLDGLKRGSVDIVIGTHRLLSRDVQFRDLALLVVDEEQRFGVAQKERIQQIRRNVDVLTLTATPIPRTLQMAVGGLRALSLLSTPPASRRAVRTIVTRWDDALLREAVERELRRGGQLFYVFNRIEGLEERAARLKQLVPGIRIAVAHGQLSETSLEKAMLAFVEGEVDCLVSTAIVENGLDIPRANTILVDGAEMLGLSQLHQLRGRVGRSHERGYCYLIVPPVAALSDESRSRIEAMSRHSDLGAGLQLATLDLELRGAGSLFGADQTGFGERIGFELYCRMLEEAAARLRGDLVDDAPEPEMVFDRDCLLPESYMEDQGLRLSYYHRLAQAHSEDELALLRDELEDRFGSAPAEVRQLFDLTVLKLRAKPLHVHAVDARQEKVALHFRATTPLSPALLLPLLQRPGTPYRLTPTGSLLRTSASGELFESGAEHLARALDELLPLCTLDGTPRPVPPTPPSPAPAPSAAPRQTRRRIVTQPRRG